MIRVGLVYIIVATNGILGLYRRRCIVLGLGLRSLGYGLGVYV